MAQPSPLLFQEKQATSTIIFYVYVQLYLFTYLLAICKIVILVSSAMSCVGFQFPDIGYTVKPGFQPYAMHATQEMQETQAMQGFTQRLCNVSCDKLQPCHWPLLAFYFSCESCAACVACIKSCFSCVACAVCVRPETGLQTPLPTFYIRPAVQRTAAEYYVPSLWRRQPTAASEVS